MVAVRLESNTRTRRERAAIVMARHGGRHSWRAPWLLAAALLLSGPAHASLFHGETLDKVADGASWFVLVIAPIVVISVFWMVHIIPEKIAEKRHHPQAKAIQVLCLLSLVFGGLLWPLALLWAMTKPVLHKAAYGYGYDDEVPAAAPGIADPERHDAPPAVEPRAVVEPVPVPQALADGSPDAAAAREPRD